MDSTALIMWGLLYGSIGMGYIMYGKKQQKGIALLSGVILCIFPYIISNIFLMILVGIIFIALPFFIRY